MKKYFGVLLFVLLIVPSIVLASWWNPFTWFDNWNLDKKPSAVEEVSNKNKDSLQVQENIVTKDNQIVVKDKITITDTKSIDKYDSQVVQKIVPVNISQTTQSRNTDDFPICRLSKRDTVKKNQLIRARILNKKDDFSNYEIVWRSNFIVKGQGQSEASFSFREIGPKIITANLIRLNGGQVTRVNCPTINVI